MEKDPKGKKSGRKAAKRTAIRRDVAEKASQKKAAKQTADEQPEGTDPGGQGIMPREQMPAQSSAKPIVNEDAQKKIVNNPDSGNDSDPIGTEDQD